MPFPPPKSAFSLWSHAAQAAALAQLHASRTKTRRDHEHSKVLHSIALERFKAYQEEFSVELRIRQERRAATEAALGILRVERQHRQQRRKQRRPWRQWEAAD